MKDNLDKGPIITDIFSLKNSGNVITESKIEVQPNAGLKSRNLKYQPWNPENSYIGDPVQKDTVTDYKVPPSEDEIRKGIQDWENQHPDQSFAEESVSPPSNYSMI